MSRLNHREDVHAILKKVKPKSRTLWRRFTSELLAAAAASSSPFTEVEDPTEVLTHEHFLYYILVIVAQAMAVSSTKALMPRCYPTRSST